MMIVEKTPYTSPRLIYVDSKRLPDLINELKMRLDINAIGRGYYLLTQSQHISDEPNFAFEDIAVYGKAYVIKAGREKMIEMSHDDLSAVKNILGV